MAKISELLKWKDWIMLVGPDGKELKKVWLRVLGDEDLKAAFTVARLKSAEARRELRDKNSIQYQERISPIDDASEEECIDIIMTSRGQNLQSEAFANTVRPDEVKLEEVALDADAPSLEEQEKLDAENERVNKEYQKALEDYIEDRKAEIRGSLQSLSLEKLREEAKADASAIMALGEFITVLEEEKCWRSVYEEEACKTKSFENLEDFRVTDSFLKEQLLDAYRKLEVGPDEIKNSRRADLGE